MMLDPHHPLRAWARRIAKSTSARPDVTALQLARRLEVLERRIPYPTPVLDSVDEAIGLLSPVRVSGIGLKRFGSEYDGGYVLPSDMAASVTGIVSIGVGSNNDCDIELAQLGLLVHAWDHTVEGLPRTHPGIAFHRTGLGDGQDMQGLDSILDTSFGRSAQRVGLMLDAEGAEWEALAVAADSTLERISVLAIEMHGLGDLLGNDHQKLAVLRRMRTFFAPIAVHVNNHGALWNVEGRQWPDALEVTYLSRGIFGGAPTTPGNCDSALFSPCCVDLADPHVDWLRQFYD